MEVSKKSAFPTSFEVSIFRPFSREFRESEQIYQMIKIWRQFFFVRRFDRSVSFPTAIENGEHRTRNAVDRNLNFI